jgi:hypothetical protein
MSLRGSNEAGLSELGFREIAPARCKGGLNLQAKSRNAALHLHWPSAVGALPTRNA